MGEELGVELGNRGLGVGGGVEIGLGRELQVVIKGMKTLYAK